MGTLQYSLDGGSTDDRSLLPQSDPGHERDPTLHLGGVELRKRLDPEPGGLEADGAKLLPNLGLLDDIGDGLAEHHARIRRHAGRPIDAEPSRQLDAGDARLFEGRHVRKARQPVRTAHGEPFDQAGFDLLHHHRNPLDEQIDRTHCLSQNRHFGRKSRPTFLFTNCSVYALASAIDGLTTPARTILSKKFFMRASVMAPTPSVVASPESTMPYSFIFAIE